MDGVSLDFRPMVQETSQTLAKPVPQITAANQAALANAAQRLRQGQLVAFPTETVYGLGADATNEQAVVSIFAAKQRPRFNPLIVHFTDRAQMQNEVVLSDLALKLAERFWPGPLTMVLPRRGGSHIALACSAGLDTMAVRVPSHPVAAALLSLVDRPLAAPSANASGAVSPTTAGHVARSLGQAVSHIIDGGACPVGLESTVIDLSGSTPRLLRPGAVTREALVDTLGPLTDGSHEDDRPLAPGQLASHYAPRLPLRCNATSVDSDESLLAFGPYPLQGAAMTINLSPRGDLTEAAAGFFAALHKLDRSDLRGIAAMPIPQDQLGAAINDRLYRAAAASYKA